MALKPCRECGHQISTEAPTCPQCGAKNPAGIAAEAAPDQEKGGCFAASLKIIGVLLGIGILGHVVSDKKDDTNTAAPVSSPSCKSDWKICSSNSDLVNNWWDWVKVQGECKTRANDAAKYGTPEWPWLSFSKFRPGNDYVSTGRAIAIEDEAKFSNVYGAMARVEVICTYDLHKMKVVDVNIIPF